MKKLIILLFILLTTGYIYINTMAPTITPGDSGELITGAYTLGIAHPPGYPLFILIGRIFSLIPLGSISFRLNLMSVFFSLCSLFVFFKICQTLFSSLTLAGIAAFFTGMSYTLWSQSIVAEVYTLHIFIVLCLFWLLIKKSNLRIFSFLLGLGLCNHHTILVFIPIFIWKLVEERKYKDIIIYINLLLGLSLYLYMPIRSFYNPVLNWGETHTFLKFTKHILRSQFGTLWKDSNILSNFIFQITFYNKILFQQISIFFLPLFLYGIYKLFSLNKIFGIYSLYLFLSFSAGTIIVLNFTMVPYILSEVSIFFMPSYIIFILISFYSLDSITKNYFFKIQYILIAILSLYCIFLIFLNFKSLNKRNNYYLYDYGLNILRSVTQNSSLFLQSNHQTFSICYLNLVENRFRNNAIFDREENFFPKIFSRYRSLFGIKNRKEIEQYLISKTPELLFFGYNSGKQKIPYGLLYSLVQKDNSIWNFFTLRGHPENISLNNLKITDYKIPEYIKIFLFGKRNNIWIEDILTRDIISMIIIARAEDLIYHRSSSPLFLLDKVSVLAYDIPSQQFLLGEIFSLLEENEKAIKAYNKVLEFIPLDFIVYNNLGIIYNIEKNYKQAEQYFQKAIEINPDITEPYYNIGIIYQDKRDFNKALDYFKKANTLDSTKPEIYYNIGIVYYEMGDLIQAEKNYKLCINKNPAYILARNNLGALYLSKKEHNKAIQQFETALLYDTISPITYFNLARAYESIDKNIAVKKWELYLYKANKHFSEEKEWIDIAQKRINELKKDLK
ncbi:MAG: DUF2723 domain-containing protein [Candidatus Firestonebacteria bacterium]|nr:DUF2723 domain-containing protein [Candidatus Firestonebacteria bacterium]